MQLIVGSFRANCSLERQMLIFLRRNSVVENVRGSQKTRNERPENKSIPSFHRFYQNRKTRKAPSQRLQSQLFTKYVYVNSMLTIAHRNLGQASIMLKQWFPKELSRVTGFSQWKRRNNVVALHFWYPAVWSYLYTVYDVQCHHSGLNQQKAAGIF